MMLTLEGVMLGESVCPAKLKLAGLTASAGADAEPVSLNVTTVGELEVLVVMLSAPVRSPAAVGQNLKLCVQVTPGASACPLLQVPTSPETKSPTLVPISMKGPTVTGDLALLVTVVTWTALHDLTSVVPRFMLGGSTVIATAAGCI
jgi:hypothetical protein